MDKKPRAALLIAILITTLALTTNQKKNNYILPKIYYPMLCTPTAPDWVEEFKKMLQRENYPGFQLSIISNNGIITNCSAGWAKFSFPPQRMSNEHRIRYASLTKIITSIELYELLNENKINLETPALAYLKIQQPAAPKDIRIENITVRDLAMHRSGFDRNASGDPMMHENPWCPSNIEEIYNAKLDFNPGEYFSYSNLGYCILGSIISTIRKMETSDFLSKRLNNTIEKSSIKIIKKGEFYPDEPDYMTDPMESIQQLNSYNYESATATGAWSGTAQDFNRFINNYFGKPHAELPNKINEFLTPPPNCDSNRWRACHGLAFYAQTYSKDRIIYWRDGSLPGVTSIAMLTPDGTTIVFLANSRPLDWMPANDQIAQSIAGYILQEKAP